LTCADVDGNGRADVVLYLGPSNGTWIYLNDSTWEYLHGTPPAEIASIYGTSGSGVLGLLAVAGAVTPAAHTASLAPADLQPIVSEALARWAAAGASSNVLDTMAHTPVMVADLSGAYLGKADCGVVYLDRDAAGYGWFVDSTPAKDEEFARLGSGSQLQAVDPQAVDRMDLLTVVEHELGHVAELDDLNSSATSLMSGMLPTGVRRNVTANEVDAIFAQQT